MFKAANPFSLHVEPIDANLHVNFFRWFAGVWLISLACKSFRQQRQYSRPLYPKSTNVYEECCVERFVNANLTGFGQSHDNDYPQTIRTDWGAAIIWIIHLLKFYACTTNRSRWTHYASRWSVRPCVWVWKPIISKHAKRRGMTRGKTGRFNPSKFGAL